MLVHDRLKNQDLRRLTLFSRAHTTFNVWQSVNTPDTVFRVSTEVLTSEKTLIEFRRIKNAIVVVPHPEIRKKVPDLVHVQRTPGPTENVRNESQTSAPNFVPGGTSVVLWRKLCAKRAP